MWVRVVGRLFCLEVCCKFEIWINVKLKDEERNWLYLDLIPLQCILFSNGCSLVPLDSHWTSLCVNSDLRSPLNFCKVAFTRGERGRSGKASALLKTKNWQLAHVRSSREEHCMNSVYSLSNLGINLRRYCLWVVERWSGRVSSNAFQRMILMCDHDKATLGRINLPPMYVPSWKFQKSSKPFKWCVEEGYKEVNIYRERLCCFCPGGIPCAY